MNKRPINPVSKLAKQIGTENVDGNSSKERILQALAFYGNRKQ